MVRNHFERVATLNQWKEERLEHLWVNLTGAALGFVEGLPENQKSTMRYCAMPWISGYGAK